MDIDTVVNVKMLNFMKRSYKLCGNYKYWGYWGHMADKRNLCVIVGANALMI